MGVMVGTNKPKFQCGSLKVKKIYKGTTQIYSSGNVVTYNFNGQNYTQEYDEGQDVLHPTVVNPSYSGATFLGWTASKSGTTALTSLKMVSDPINLYALFKYNDYNVPASWFNGYDPGGGMGPAKIYITPHIHNRDDYYNRGAYIDVKNNTVYTIYTIDKNKYYGTKVTAHYGLQTSNNSTGQVGMYAYVNGQLIGSRIKNGDDSYTGNRFGGPITVTGTGNATVQLSIGGFITSGEFSTIAVKAITLLGKTTTI